MKTSTLFGPAPTQGNYLKVSVFLKKKPEVTDEFFHAYWANNHIVPALATKTFMDKVRRYNQYHIAPEYREKLQALGMPALDYDGIGEVWVDSFEDWTAIVTDPEFQKNVSPDEPNFICAPIHFLVGFDNLVIGGDDWKPAKQ